MLRFSDDKKARILMARIPDAVLRVLIQHRAFIAGGAVACLFSLGRRPKDYDIYFRTAQDYGNAIDDILEILKHTGYGYVEHSPKWYTIRLDDGVYMDFIGFDDTLREPEEVITSFDFTACMGAYDIVSKVFCASVFFKRDNELRRLTYNNHSKNRPSSVVRMVRYIEKYGYTITDMEIRTMFNCIFDAEVTRKGFTAPVTSTANKEIPDNDYSTYFDEDKQDYVKGA